MILCIGDYIEDFYVFGTASRLCPEAPVPVVVPHIERTTAGGVGLVENQLRELGADVFAWYGSFSRKERAFCGSHLVSRIDRDSLPFNPQAFPDEVVRQCDAVIVSDYGKGALFEEIAEELKASGKTLYVDAKNHWRWYIGENTYWFPNEREIEHLPMIALSSGRVIEKRGAEGCNGFEKHLPATVSEVVDVTGAGDIFMAGFVYAHVCQKLSGLDSLEFANTLAGESCRHRGTYVVDRKFAQAVIDSLRSSKESEELRAHRALNSSERACLLSAQWKVNQDTLNKTVAKFDNLPEDWIRDAAEQGRASKILDSWQTPQKSPSDPRSSNDVPIQERIDLRSDMKGQ